MTGNGTIMTVPDELTYIAVEARENPKVPIPSSEL